MAESGTVTNWPEIMFSGSTLTGYCVTGIAYLMHDCLNAAVMPASMTGNALLTALTGIVYKLIDGKACIDRILYPVVE